MKYRRLGKNGMRISEVSLGAWITYGGTVDNKDAWKILERALELGVNFIDNADVYAAGKAEEVVGEYFSSETHERKNYVLSSKVFWPMSDQVNDSGLSRKHIMDSIDGTLKRYQQDYIDIYYCHRFDWKTPLRETIEAMDDLIKDGKIRYWGTSVWSAANLERAVGIANEIGASLPAVEQPRYNMLDRHIELEIMETTSYHGMGITPWSPLQYGILTGKYNDGKPEGSRLQLNDRFDDSLNEESLSKVRDLTKMAGEMEITMAQLALAWILRRPEISSVITGATKIEQIESNVMASEINLSKDDLEEIDEILQNKPEFHGPYKPALSDRS